MKRFPVLPVRKIVGQPDIIGIGAGKRALPRLVAAATAVGEADSWVVVDFDGIDMVSASAARESVLAFIAFLNERGVLPVHVNLNDESLEEVAFAAEALGRPVVTASSIVKDIPKGIRVLGTLDAKQLQTLRIVAELGEADAKSASDASQDASTGVTAWNNRLSILAGMRFLQVRKAGKTKYYSLTLKGLVDGN